MATVFAYMQATRLDEGRVRVPRRRGLQARRRGVVRAGRGAGHAGPGAQDAPADAGPQLALPGALLDEHRPGGRVDPGQHKLLCATTTASGTSFVGQHHEVLTGVEPQQNNARTWHAAAVRDRAGRRDYGRSSFAVGLCSQIVTLVAFRVARPYRSVTEAYGPVHTRRSVSITRASEAASRTALTLSNLALSSACVARFDGRLRSSSARPAYAWYQHV